jgi:hypothetical protein
MNGRLFPLALLVAGIALPALADVPPSPVASAAPVVFNDPSINFTVPDGWVKITPGAGAAGPDSGPVPIVGFVQNLGKSTQRAIVVSTQDISGQSLDAFESDHEQSLRSNHDGVFVSHTKTTLANGMPAYWLKVTLDDASGMQAHEYEWVVSDLKRGIIATYSGKQPTYGESDARAAMAGLKVVVYPARSN